MANYGWKRSFLLFLDSAATVDVLTASNNDVNFVKTQTVQSRPPFHALANFIFCLPPELPRDIAFIPSILKREQR